MSAAIFIASASAWPFGTSRPTRPKSSASRAVTWRPVSRISAAKRVGDLPPQAHARAAERKEAAPRLGDAEDRVLGGDADVGALQDLGAAGDGVAFDRGDDRLHRPVVAQQRLPVDVGHLGHELHELVVDLAAAHRLQIGAGAEDVAAAGEDRDAQLGIVVEHAPGRGTCRPACRG